MKRFLVILFLTPSISFGAYTEFYCNASTGNNLNAGSDENGNAVYTSTNGNWNGSSTFTPSDGTNPVSSGVAVGQFASVYLDAASAPTAFIARITAVTNSANGTITVSTTSRAGTIPASGATGRTIKVGGTWKGPTGSSGFPITFSNGGAGTLSSATDTSTNSVRVNFKNNATYSITSAVSGTAQQASHMVQGYNSSVGDGGKATIDGGGNNIQILTMGTGQHLSDFIVSNVGVTTGTSVGLSTGSSGSLFRVVVHDVRSTGITLGLGSVATEVEVYAYNKGNNAGGAGISFSGGNNTARRCYIHDATGSNSDGILTTSGTSPNIIDHCIFDTLGGNGITLNSNGSAATMYFSISNSDFYNNTGAGIKVSANAGNYYVHIENNNFIKNGTYGFDGGASFTRLFGFMFNNGYGSGTQANGSGTTNATSGIVETGAVTYPSNVTPYNAPSTGDFSLVNTNTHVGYNAGRGAFTQTDGTNTGTVGHPDIGAAQHNDSCSGTGPCQTSNASSN